MVIFTVLAERKLMASKQRRIGPNSIGYKGLMQTLADGVKLILKETIVPIQTNQIIFILSPLYLFIICFLNYFILPLNSYTFNYELNDGIIYTIMLSEQSILATLYSGYSSNSKYSLLGALRSILLMISYSIGLSLSILIILSYINNFNYSVILYTQFNTNLIFVCQPIFFSIIQCAIAELGRCPFDLIEAESELVAGQMTEYSAVIFAFFFLGEYSKMLFKGLLISSLLLGSLNPKWFIFILIWLRSSFPRIKINDMLYLGWNHIIPLLTAYLIFNISIIYTIK